MAMSIDPLVHRCVVPTGPAAGNKNNHEVSVYDVQYAERCEFCGNLLAPPDALMAHIYEQLLEQR